MNAYQKLFVVVFIFLCIMNAAQAQVSKSNSEVGLSAGTTIYQGDIEPGTLGSYKRLRPSFSIYGGRWLDKYFLLQGSFTHASITANDSDWSTPAYKQLRNLNFHTSINEVDARLIFSPFGNVAYTPEKRWYPYAFIGAGIAFTHIKRNWSGIDSSFLTAKNINNLALDSAHKLPSAIPSLFGGAGVRYVLSSHVSLFADVTYRLPVADYLDGFSYFANPQHKDDYYNFCIGINYTFFNNASKCPRVKR